MHRKLTFYSDDEQNEFFDDCNSKNISVFIIKFVVTFNPFTKTREFHYIVSGDERMRQGMHMRTITRLGVVANITKLGSGCQ